MEFRTYFTSLDSDGRKRFAKRARTSVMYIQLHLMATPPRKVPRPDLMRRLVDATQGACSMRDVLNHFYAEAAA